MINIFIYRIVNFILQKSSQENQDLVTKSRLFLILWFGTTMTMWFYVFYCFFTFGKTSPVFWGGLFFSILHTLTPLFFKWTQSFSISGSTLSLTGLGFQALFCLYSGGIYSPAVIWLTFHPIILGFFGTPPLMTFSALFNIAIVLILYFLGKHGNLPQDSLPVVFRDSTIISSYLGLNILVALFTVTALKVNHSKNKALKTSKELSENLLRIVIHDINNPLSIIGHFTKHLKGNDPATNLRSANQIIKASDDLIRITESVTSWMVHKDNQKEFYLEDIPVKDLIEHIQFAFEDKLTEKEIKINFHLEDSDLIIFSDRAALFYQVFNNLISNAIKFSFEKSSIDFSVLSTKTYIIFKIRDHGVGIDALAVDKVFSPYLNRSTAGTFNEKGFGFGLPIVATVLKRLNGKILIEKISPLSKESKGSCFTVYLPRANSTSN